MKTDISESLNRELRYVRVSPALHARILRDVRSERRRRRRRRSSALPAIAAILVLTLAVIGGLRIMQKPVPDRNVSSGSYTAVWADDIFRVYHSRHNCVNHPMEVISLAEARARGYSACERCIHIAAKATEKPTEVLTTPTPAQDIEEMSVPAIALQEPITDTEDLVYIDASDFRFHTDESHLSQDAVQVTRGEALLDGYYPCSTCGEDSEVYWMTDGGVWFHSAKNCQSMVGAYSVSALNAFKSGKQACPHCIGQEVVWITNGGDFYCASQFCQNTASPKQVTQSDAEAAGKTRCAYCFVSPMDSAWLSQLQDNVYVNSETYVADGRLIMYFHGTSYASFLLGTPVPEQNLPDEETIFSDLQSYLGENYPLSNDELQVMAKDIAAGGQIGLRTLQYDLGEIHVYDEAGEIAVENVCAYASPESAPGMLIVADIDSDCTPIRATLDFTLSGVSLYLDESGAWNYLKVNYAPNLAVTGSEDDLTASSYSVYIGGESENAVTCKIESEVSEIAHIGFSTLYNLAIDAYGDNTTGEYSLLILRGDTDFSSSLFTSETSYSDASDFYAEYFEPVNENAESTTVILLGSAIIQEEVFHLALNVQSEQITQAHTSTQENIAIQSP